MFPELAAGAALADGLIFALQAVRENRPDVLRQIAETAPEILHAKDDRGVTPAHAAAEAGNDALIHYLSTVAPASLSAKDVFGQSPAHYAAKAGNARALQELIDAEADVNNPDIFGYTPVDLGRHRNREDVVGLLETEIAVRASAITGLEDDDLE